MTYAVLYQTKIANCITFDTKAQILPVLTHLHNYKGSTLNTALHVLLPLILFAKMMYWTDFTAVSDVADIKDLNIL